MLPGGEIMLGLPASTELNKKQGRNIPKTKFFSNIDLTGAQERLFVDELSSIKWMNKISPATMNLTISNGILELEVFYLKLKGMNVSERLLKIIDSAIVHPIIYVLDNENTSKIMISYKESSDSGKVNVKTYYSTEWVKDLPSLDFNALTTGELYQSLISQISDSRIITPNSEVSLAESVSLDIDRQKALAEIEKLEQKIKRTNQPNKKIELVHQLRELKETWGVD
ncbi:DUF4391 domain-containing protein [Methanomethylophilus alvi]|uniref:DUF4391 domain-containing protein n=1 Tax=Methanomethylophilus alvi TaxID=1291540 RepID=UPI0037DC6EFF